MSCEWYGIETGNSSTHRRDKCLVSGFCSSHRRGCHRPFSINNDDQLYVSFDARNFPRSSDLVPFHRLLVFVSRRGFSVCLWVRVGFSFSHFAAVIEAIHDRYIRGKDGEQQIASLFGLYLPIGMRWDPLASRCPKRNPTQPKNERSSSVSALSPLQAREKNSNFCHVEDF